LRVILSEAKNLLVITNHKQKQMLRLAQHDLVAGLRVFVIYTSR
jgi:hypothetical protein